MPRFSRLLLLFAAAALFVAGCDSNDMSDDEDAATVQFGTAALSVGGPGTAELPITLTEATGSAVTVEVLFAAASSDSVSLSDLSIASADGGSAYYDEDGDLTGYVIETVEFDASAEAGATRTATVNVDDGIDSGRKVLLFALQSAASADGSPVRIGGQRTLTFTVGTITLLEATFDYEDSDGEFPDPFTAISVASSANWATNSRDDFDTSPFAQANAFGADEPANDWLISPAIDFTATETQTLSFLNAKNFDDGGLDGEALRVLVSTDYDGSGNPEDFIWADISGRVNYSEGGYETVSSGDIDLSDEEFQTDATYVAFQYVSSGTGAGTSELWRIDEVTLTGAGG